MLLGMAFLFKPILLPAQEQATRIGIGVSLGKEAIPIDDNFVFSWFDYPNFYIPILISSHFRLEPVLGFYHYSRSRDDMKRSDDIFSLGCGIFPVTQKEKLYIYYGARLEAIHYSSSYEYPDFNNQESDKASKTDFYIGPAIGGEYFFSEHFSLGGEDQVSFIFIGQDDGSDNDSESAIRNKTLFFLRWYF